MSDRLEANEDEWRMYSEPVTEDMLMCMKPSHERLEADLENARARIAQLEAVAVAAAPFRHDPVQGHSPDTCPGCNLAAALDAAALSSPEGQNKP